MGVIKLSELTDNSLVQVQSLDDLKAIRVTGWDRFASCPRRWYAEMLGLSDIDATQIGQREVHQNKWAKMGTAAHHVIELFLSPEWTDKLPGSGVCWVHASKFLEEQGMGPTERANLLRYLGTLEREGWRDNVVVTELKLEGSPRPYCLPMGGTLDYIGLNRELDCWDILDHKTNRSFEPAEVWAAKLQPMFYTWLYRKYLKEMDDEAAAKPIRYTIGYVNLGQMVSWVTDLAMDAHIEEVYEQLWQEFSVYKRTGEWPERLNEWCASCPVMGGCTKAKEALNSFAALAEKQEAQGISMLERASFLSNTVKLAETLLEGLREEIKNRMLEEGAEVWTDAGLKASLTRPTRRSIDFCDLWDLLAEYGMNQQEMRDLFSVKMAGLDTLIKEREELALPILSVMQTKEAETPTLTIRKAGRK